MPAPSKLRNAIGDRGESIVQLCLTDYSVTKAVLFEAGFLGGKWPAIDFYVELRGVIGLTPFFFAQVKTTTSAFRGGHIRITIAASKLKQMAALPGPTYIFAVHEPSKRVFIRRISATTPVAAARKIPLANELTPTKLRLLYDEVEAFWRAISIQTQSSSFL